jgi:hypothetical protein
MEGPTATFANKAQSKRCLDRSTGRAKRTSKGSDLPKDDYSTALASIASSSACSFENNCCTFEKQ